MIIPKYGEKISLEKRKLISTRYKCVTKAINREFWNSISDTAHSLYVGSYGRGTAINTSDIDIMVILPKSEYYRYDNLNGNGQSRLLQALRKALLKSYPNSNIRADGQIVKIKFYDGMKFEILPAFENKYLWDDSTYIYPDSNMGGRWLSTNPKKEQEAMKDKNSYNFTNGLLMDTCKHMRKIRDLHFKSYTLSGIVIDSFAYHAIQGWCWAREAREGESNTSNNKSYEEILYDYYVDHCSYITTLTAPGSGDSVPFIDSKECLLKVLTKIKECS